MALGYVLRALCREPRSSPKSASGHGDPLSSLRVAFPALDEIIAGQRVVDFGCGVGTQAVGLALAGARAVIGVDINDRYLAQGRALAARHGVPVVFAQAAPSEQVDVVISKDSMEHFRDPREALRQMSAMLAPGGRALITFSPPWFSAYGAHMQFMTPVPWVHLLFPESVVMEARSRYKSDGARRYQDVEGGLNKMSLGKFEGLIQNSGLIVERLCYTATKRLPVVTRVPLLRELLTVRVDCTLRTLAS